MQTAPKCSEFIIMAEYKTFCSSVSNKKTKTHLFVTRGLIIRCKTQAGQFNQGPLTGLGLNFFALSGHQPVFGDG